MLAVCVSSGALLLVVLFSAGHCYPAKPGFKPSSYYGGSDGGKAASAGSNWEASAPGRFDPSPSGPASKTYSKEAPRSQVAQRRQPSYAQPSAPAQPIAAHYSQNPYAQDIDWVVAPPSPYSGEEMASGKPEPSNVGPPAPPPGPQYQAGELSHMQDSFEFGSSESETEELGYQQSPLEAQAVEEQESASAVEPSGLGGGWVQYPYPYDFMFLTGQYPPGTISHFQSSYERGQDHWEDSHYIRDYYPSAEADPVPQQEVTFPTDFVTQSVQQPSQPAQQSVGSTNYDWSEPDQSYGGYYQEPDQFDQLPQYSPAGGYDQSQVGHD